MSKETQKHFSELAGELNKRIRDVIYINEFSYEEKGYLSIARYKGYWGVIELLYGPAEWNVEIFIELWDRDGRLQKFDLAELMNIDVIRNWILENRPDESAERLNRQFNWIEQFLRDGLKPCVTFDRLYK